MSLSKVGANEGTHTALLNEVLTKARSFNVYAAGGVRNIEDLISLKKMGIHGALIATALHQKQISSAQLYSL
jgi:phosphoribosylformimino-5-aminoimidazole carboxamide ribotide isomerase